MDEQDKKKATRLITLDVARKQVTPPIPLSTMRYWQSKGLLPVYRVGRRVYLSQQDWDDYLSRGFEPAIPA